MAEVKVSQLQKAVQSLPDDKFMIVQSGTNKQIEFADLLSNISSTKDIVFGGDNNINIKFKSANDTTLFNIETAGNGRVSINGDPTLSDVEFQIHGDVKIENRYLDSFDLLKYDIGGGIGGADKAVTENGVDNAINLTTETTKLWTYDNTNVYSLGRGVPGQTKNIIFMKKYSSNSAQVVINVDPVDVPDQTKAQFNRIIMSKVGAGCVLKYVTDAGEIATGTATISNGEITAISVDSAGYGYTETPTITIVGGGGTNAAATAVMSGGKVSSVTIDNGGSGYSTVPTIIFSGQTEEGYWMCVGRNDATLAMIV